MLAELRALVQDPTQLGQLPVFMTHLGAAVKQHRAHYALYAMFRPVTLPGAIHQYLWQGRRPATIEQLQKHLVSMWREGCTRRYQQLALRICGGGRAAQPESVQCVLCSIGLAHGHGLA
jgi:hypothetical protein